MAKKCLAIYEKKKKKKKKERVKNVGRLHKRRGWKKNERGGTPGRRRGRGWQNKERAGKNGQERANR